MPCTPVKMSELDQVFAVFAALVYFLYGFRLALLYLCRVIDWGIKRLFIRVQSRQRTVVYSRNTFNFASSVV
jgi:hypothetical protein